MGKKVAVVVGGRQFEVDEAIQKRWPVDYPLAETKDGRPTAAARRAKKAEKPPERSTTKTADDLTVVDPEDAGPGDDTTKEA